MSSRMQVLMDEAELQRFRNVSRERGLTLAEWVRQSLRKAAEAEALGDVDVRVQAIRRSALHAFPAPDVEHMLQEIERGYSGGRGA